MSELFAIDLVKVAGYVIMFVPGFIYIQTIEHHLLREKKPQFEKTIEIILSSAIIWAVALSSPFWWPLSASRDNLLALLSDSFNHRVSVGALPDEIGKLGKDISNVFFVVCGWTLVVANSWGLLRKQRHIDAVIKNVTGRDWYPSVAFKFFKENLNNGVEVSLEGKRYLGVLYSAPDSKEDKYIILINPVLIDEQRGVFEELPFTKKMIISLESIKEMKSYSSEILKQEKKK